VAVTKPHFNSKTKFEVILQNRTGCPKQFQKKTGSHWFSQTRPLEAESRFFIKMTILAFDEMKNFHEE